MNKLALAIRHVHFEDCGVLGDALMERGFELRYIDVARGALAQADPAEADLVIGLGGPVSVYDAQDYPWIEQELSLIRLCLKLRKPILGICLGAQMLASALGARVYPGPVKELGWQPLTLTAEGADSIIAPLARPGLSMLHWHGDTFDLPAGARLLASTRAIQNQIFEWGGHVLAFQCHPEIRADEIESWLIGHAVEIAAMRGVSVARLRAQSTALAPALTSAAREVFARWLESVRL